MNNATDAAEGSAQTPVPAQTRTAQDVPDARIRHKLIWVLYGIVATGFSIPILYFAQQLWFFNDEFSYLGVATNDDLFGGLFLFHNEHLVVWNRIWYWALANTIGIDTYWPYTVFGVMCDVVIGAAALGITKQLTNRGWLALMAGLAVLCAGVGAGDLWWAGQVAFLIPLMVFMLWVWLDVTSRLPSVGWRLNVLAGAAGIVGIFGSQVFLPLAIGLAAGLAFTARRWAALSLLCVPFAVGIVGRLQTAPPASEESALEIRGIFDFVAAGLTKPFDIPLGVDHIGWLFIALIVAGVALSLGKSQMRAPVLSLATALVVALGLFSISRVQLFGSEPPSRYLHVVFVLAIPLLAVGLNQIAELFGRRLPSGALVVRAFALVLLAALIVGGYKPYEAEFDALRVQDDNRHGLIQASANLLAKGFQTDPNQDVNPGFNPAVSASTVVQWLVSGVIGLNPVPESATNAARVNLSYATSSDVAVPKAEVARRVCAPYSGPVPVGRGILVLVNLKDAEHTSVTYAVLPAQRDDTRHQTTGTDKSFTVTPLRKAVATDIPAMLIIRSGAEGVTICKRP